MLEVAPIEADQLSPCGKGSEAGFASQGLWVREMDLQLLPGFHSAVLKVVCKEGRITFPRKEESWLFREIGLH